MKITAYDELYPLRSGVGSGVVYIASGSNSAAGDTSAGGDVVGDPGDLAVVGLRRAVSLASNIGGGTVGDVLTIIQSSPRLAMFATPSNSGVSFGSNATRVSETAAVGALSTAAREDHRHDGIGTITASSSNTLQRGTVNLRPGTNVTFGLTDTDGDGEHDTLTINASASGGGSGLTIEEVDGSPTNTATKLVLPNGTLSYAGTVATYTPSGGSSKYDPAGSPTTATDVGVEYDDGTHNSFTWAPSDPATNDASTYASYALFGATDTAERWYNKAWSPGSGDITAAIRVSVNQKAGSGGFGVYVGSATGDDPSDAVLFQVNPDGSNLQLSAYNRNTGTFSQIGSNLQVHTGAVSTTGFLYLRMTRTTGPVWTFYWSFDGIGWVAMATTGSKSLTIGSIGFRMDSYSVATAVALDYIRGWTSAVTKIGS